jgi:hypothetical protein
VTEDGDPMNRRTETVKMDKVEVSLFGLIKGSWVLDNAQRRAAWEMYVELITRTTVCALDDNDGLVREALSSLHALFGETRRILKASGPDVVVPIEGGTVSFGHIAIDVLNQGLRPFLSKWHPLLQAHESTRQPGVSPAAHERGWVQHDELRQRLKEIRRQMTAYADLLAQACGVEPCHAP